MLVNGGELSQYPNEDIILPSVEDAKNWIERICGHEYAEQVIPTEPAAETKPAAKKTATAAKKPAAKKPAAKKTATKKTAAKNNRNG